MTVVCSSRRLFIKNVFKGAAVLTLVNALPSQAFNLGATGERTLTFYNRHTGERQKTCYWINGIYQPEAIGELSHLLRDHRQNEAAVMDVELYDLLFNLQSRLETSNEIHVISGYRSVKTNALLAAKSGGVAKKSYHMKGMAMDIAIPGIDLQHIHQAALSLKAGGVGCYPRSGFVHVDTGRVRSW